jgi:prevent-host-death family protein
VGLTWQIPTLRCVPTIPRRELRNNVTDVLRRAERGERFTITVNGRAVAELGPLGPGARTRGARTLDAVLADTPVDAGWAADLDDLRQADSGAADNPWCG